MTVSKGNRPDTLGATQLTQDVGTSVSTLVTPAANTAGLIIRSLLTNPAGNSPDRFQVYADTAAPAALDDGTKLCIWDRTKAVGDRMFLGALLIPAGRGLYAIAGTAGSELWLTYDLLS